MKYIKKLIRKVKNIFKMQTEHERENRRMYEFLSEAKDRIHLEVLQKEWDNRFKRNTFNDYPFYRQYF